MTGKPPIGGFTSPALRSSPAGPAHAAPGGPARSHPAARIGPDPSALSPRRDGEDYAVGLELSDGKRVFLCRALIGLGFVEWGMGIGRGVALFGFAASWQLNRQLAVLRSRGSYI